MPRAADADRRPPFEGLYVPLANPLRGDGSIDEESLARLAEHVIRGGADGLWINGTTGEFYALDRAQRARAVQIAAEAAEGRVHVVAHAGDASTRAACEHARAAIDAGADFIASLPPFYLAHGEGELRRHFERVAEAAGRPIALYDFPAFAKVSLDRVAPALARDGTAVAIKVSAPSLESYRRLVAHIAEAAPAFLCLHGMAGLAHASLFCGGAGLVCALANVIPDRFARLCALAQAGDWESVRREQSRIAAVLDPMQDALVRRAPLSAPMTAAIKYALKSLRVIESDRACEPFEPLDERERAALDAVVAALEREA